MTPAEQHINNAVQALKLVPWDHPAVKKICPSLYQADSRLQGYVKKFFDAWSKKTKKKKTTKADDLTCGKLLEQVAFLLFNGLRGANLDSYQSAAGPQYDLLASGNCEFWGSIAKVLYLGDSRPGILVEAKAWQDKIEDAQFSRMCALLGHNLHPTIRLGVFLTLKGATGFPDRGGRRKRALSDCALRQLLFHAKTGIYIVVLDEIDLKLLGKGENLIAMLREKIEAVVKQPGLLPLAPVSSYMKSSTLPAHLAALAP